MDRYGTPNFIFRFAFRFKKGRALNQVFLKDRYGIRFSINVCTHKLS